MATRVVGLALAMLSAGALPGTAEDGRSALKAIQLSFKLDPRLTDATYGGERWVSPKTYTGVTGQNVVEVRATGVDASGMSVPVSPEWTTSDAAVLVASPARGDRVKITVNRAGEGTVRLVARGVEKELAVRATSRDDRLQIEIVQRESKVMSSAPPVELASKEPPKTLSTAELAEKNQREGDAFLAKNAKRSGVVALKSGLQYQVLKAGTGLKPTLDATVVLEYLAMRLDGTRVAGTGRNQPMSLPLRVAIAGWREALQQMPAGSTWRLFVPPSLAYGEQGVPRSQVGPNATLVFDVALISVSETPAQQQGAATPARAARGESPTSPVRRRHR